MEIEMENEELLETLLKACNYVDKVFLKQVLILGSWNRTWIMTSIYIKMYFELRFEYMKMTLRLH